MNNKHILDLTLRLSQALDQNYDVVSMETVMSVISALEGTEITKEELEATRLAKYINQFRRRTKCENLARRAKSLLKRWREMVGMQQSNESSISASGAAYQTTFTAITCISDMPGSDNASNSINAQFSHQYYQRQQQYSSSNKQQIIQAQPYHSQPSSPVNLQEKSNPNKFVISTSNPATGSQMPKSSSTNVRKKRKLDKNIKEPSAHPQPTSFANLISGLGSPFSSSKKTTKYKSDPAVSSVKPVETFIIEHSSNSNSDIICVPFINTVSNNFTSATDVPPVVIDLQDTNSSMNSLVSKDVANASSFLYQNKISANKSKKDKERKDRNIISQQIQPLQDCDEQNTTTASCQNKRIPDVVLLDEKSHSACPAISNISEILSLSNSSVSSLFPAADAMSKNIYHSGQNESAPPAAKMSKSDLTFAGKFKQNSSLISTNCNIMYCNSDSTNANNLNYNSLKQSNFSLFGGIETNSNDSSVSSRTSSFHMIGNAVRREASTSEHNIEDGGVKDDMNEKSMSNISNKGNSYTDNTFVVGAKTVATAGQQNQQSIDLTMDFLTQQTIKQPKKRGRKKGSKGIDSIIAKESSLSSQMLISSLGVAGKKVKTTKELYAEMESRKLRNVKFAGLGEMLGNSSATWIGHQQQQKVVNSRRPSFCSEIGDSDSCTMTSDPSHDSGNIVSKATISKSEKPLENNSNFSKHDSKLKTDNIKNDESRLFTYESSVLESTSKIQLEIQEVLKLFTPPSSVTEIECESFNNIIPCTCTIEETAVLGNNECNESIVDNNSKDSNLNPESLKNVSEKETNHFPIKVEQMEVLTDVFKRKENDKKNMLPQKQTAKVKKSIFDLDFDDDEDPLNTIIADIAGKILKAETESTISPSVTDDKPGFLVSSQDYVGKSYLQNDALYASNVPIPASDNIVFPTYEVKFDPDCKAKNRFQIQPEKITKFHIDTLHNCFIPSVNGNWNHADPVSTLRDIDKTDLKIDGYDVVPSYGSDMNEKIVKDLSHIKFSKLLKVKHSKCSHQNEILFHIPFLGVSRILAFDDTNLYSKAINTKTMDEEKENVRKKLNLNNILNTSALHTNGVKDKQELERVIEREQSFEIYSSTSKIKSNRNLKSSIRRTKKHVTLVKKSTIKRLKLAVTGYFDLETNTSDSNDTENMDESKLHTSLFYHEELCPMVRNDSILNNECIFHISSCSSGCDSTDEETTNEIFSSRKLTSSTSSSSSSEHQMLSLQREIIGAEVSKIENSVKNKSDILDSSEIENAVSDNADVCDDEINENDVNDLPDENNHMLLSFNNICYKSTREENTEQKNKDHEINKLKQQLQNCDDYNNLNNNFNLIKYIDNKTSSISNINNNSSNSCSKNYSDTNIAISSSSCYNENITNLIYHQQYKNNNSNDNDVQIKKFKEYQTGIRAVDDDVDGDNSSRMHQFKEWHEVLQFRSYNDELLTILPYVVLE